MRWRYILKVVGALTLFLAAAMLPALGVGLIYRDASVRALSISIGLTLAGGLALYLSCVRCRVEIVTQREGMTVVALGWTVIGLFGALPFYFEGSFPVFVDALFESVSGFTTTGSSVLGDIEAVSPGLLFWRSLIQWLGGMGIIVLSIAILPFLGVGGMQLYKAEVPSPVPDKLQPRIRDTALILWKVYAGMTAAQVVLLMLGGMSLFDAACHAFTTMPTGGFSTRNASVAAYNSAYIDGVIVLFMLLAGVNFSLHYQFLKGRRLAFWKDAECRFFFGAVALLTLLVSVDVWGAVYDSAAQALRYGAFQVMSILTTTGYATADYEQWPAMSQLILLLCMFLGASAGSTGGGMKCLRVMLGFKYCYRELFTLVHPRAVTHVKLAGRAVPDDVMRSVMGFMALYVALFAVCSVLLAGLGVDFVTAFAAVASALGNVGPGFGGVGPVENFGHLPALGKWLLIWCMLLGRLEIFTVIILLVPEFWRK